MSEQFKSNEAEQKFQNYSGQLDQVTTRGDGKLELGEAFNKNLIDFTASLQHLNIHHEGKTAGSQFNGRVFENSSDVQGLINKLLPDELHYDQFGRAEITLDVSGAPESLGWTGIKRIEEIKKSFPDAVIESRPRIDGGIEAEEDDVSGAWYPEMARDPKSGRFEVLKDENGEVKNLKGKFEPNANIVSLPSKSAETNKITVIMQKDKSTGKPTVLTIFPGENAPAFPAKINSESYKASTLGNTQETRFWKDHAFIQQT